MLENTIKKLSKNRKQFIIFTVCLSIILYFVFYTIFGTRGVVDYFKIRSQLQENNLTKDKLFIEIENKKNLVDRIKDESLDLDLLDEQVRKNLGYAKKDEIIIYEDEKPN